MCVGGGGGLEPLSLDHRQAISAKIRYSVTSIFATGCSSLTLDVAFVNHGKPSSILHLGTKPRLIYDIYGLWSELNGRAQPPSSIDRPL